MTSIILYKTLREYDLDVSFDVQAGQCLALIGPTGCGKTTTLRIISGIEQPARGRVEIDEHVLLDTERGINLPPQKRHVGFVFQDFALFPHLTVLGNVMYSAAVRALSKSEGLAVAQQALQRVRLEGVENVKPAQLSGGQQQRVALARALASGAQLLLMDEPMSALDAFTRRQVRSELKALIADLGLQTIIVTHDVTDALTLGDVIGVMLEGKLVQVGTQRQLLSQPRNAFVAEFLGVNLLSGQARTRGNDLSEVRVGGQTFYALSQVSGEVLVTFHPWDVSISLIEPESSAMNVLKGRLTSISHLGGRTRVTVENDVTIIAELAQASEERLALQLGQEVWASFKASALRLYT